MLSGAERRIRLQALFLLFVRLGTLGFGGPQAHIAMQNDEAVGRRQWLTPEEFTEGMAICEMLPGPASTQLGIYIGYLRAGWLGALVAGVGFIAPAYGFVVVLSWAYFQFQRIPQLTSLFLGISPVVIGILLGFCWTLGKKTLTDWTRVAIAVVVLALSALFHLNIFLLFLGAGGMGFLLYGSQVLPLKSQVKGLWLPMVPGLMATVPSPELLAVSSLWGSERIGEFFLPLTLVFLKVGGAIYGGGLVIIPLLSDQVVDQLHWLSATEFLDGVAIGQITPGPVVLTAAFIGYKVAGILGSLIATVAIFAPSFVFIMLATPLLSRLRQNPGVKGFLQGITPAALGAMAAAVIPLAQQALVQPTGIRSGIALGITIATLVALLKYKTPTWQLVLAGSVLGLSIGLLPI